MPITDHNSVRGIAEATATADSLKVLSGVDTYEGRNLHLLGYCFDHTRKEYADMEQAILKQEKDAAEEKIKRFTQSTGIPVSLSEALTASGDGVVTGELIAKIVLSRTNAADHGILRTYLPGGAKYDMPNVMFYWDFFSKGRPAYVPIHYLSLQEAVSLIHSTGGIAVLAHPRQSLAGNDNLLPGIISEGIDGIEVYSSYHSRPDCERYWEAARQNHLFITCGSDFHGRQKPNLKLGEHGRGYEDKEIFFRG